MSAIDGRSHYHEPVFIVGMPRSGTTLIQGILCNTQKYFPMPETHFFSRVVYGLPEILSQEQLQNVVLALYEKSRIEVDKNVLLKHNSQKEVFEYVIGKFNTENKDTFLEKTPRHVFFYSKILSYYPSAKFICMIREPKNVVSSQLTNTRIEKKSVIRLSFLYNKIAAAILNIRDNNNVFIIKYEDLTNEPESILKKAFNFLAIPYNSKYVEKAAAPPEIVAEHEFWKNKNIEGQIIQINDPGRWRIGLSDSQADLVNMITKRFAENFGYELNYSSIRACYSFFRDMGNLSSRREILRLFSKIHG